MNISTLPSLAITIAFSLLLERSGGSRLRKRTIQIIFAFAVVLITFATLSILDLGPIIFVLWVVGSERIPALSGKWVAAAVHSRAMPWILSVATALVIFWAWGSAHPFPVVDDEAAYVLQAHIFAAGHWSAPAAPIPDFFQQLHIFVTPVIAAKYFPGHALALSAGVLLGFPWLVPVLFAAVSGGIVFALARRLTNAWIGLLSWFVWATAPGTLRWRASYFSEGTTGALWLIGWWSLERWRSERRRRWLFLLAASLGASAVTRPYTSLLLLPPVAICVLRISRQQRAWLSLARAIALGAGILLLIPLWNLGTLGDWRTTPISEYTRLYMPYDRIGFGPTDAAPLCSLPPDLALLNARLQRDQSRHVPRQVAKIVSLRGAVLGEDVFGAWRAPFLVFALIGAAGGGPGVLFGLASTFLLFAGHLFYWHPAALSAYYVESHPVFSFFSALGLVRVLASFGSTSNNGAAAPVHVVPAGAILLALGMAGFGIRDVQQAGLARERDSRSQRRFQSLIESIPEGRAIVFVRYSPTRVGGPSLVTNLPELEKERVWVVRDLGSRNQELLRRAPDRTAYLYDERIGTVRSLKGGERRLNP